MGTQAMIKKGDRVFFADNSKGYLERCEAFAGIARGAGLTPVYYGGVGAAVRQSNQDKDIRDDFWKAHAIVLYLGAPNDNSDYDDHWVLPEISHRVATGVDCLIYVSDNFPLSTLQKYGYAGPPKVLSVSDDFGAALRSDLEKIIA
jgi:hypothetical protein